MSDISEKNGSEDRIDDIEKVANSRGSATPVDAHYDPKFVKKTLLMIDWRMLPLLGLLYAIALVDRTNMGVARTAGMLKDLRLDIGERYSIASMIYFVPYIILQIPANLVLRKLGAQTFLTICVVGWGAAQVGMGFVTNWGLLCVTRVLLGIFEAGFFPALVFIITTWYKRHEVQKRLAVFYLCSIVIGGFSSILAYGITFLKGKGGLNGWQWIFVLEGILTILLGVLTWMFVPDFPDKARFLNDNQRKMILDRIEADRADSMPDKMARQKFFAAFFDPLTWSFAIMFMASTMPAYAIGFFSTIIINGMGYSAAMALLLTAFPYVAAAISCFFFAWLADKTRMRAVWLAAQNVICIIGLMCTGYTSSPAVRYFGLFFINMGASGCVPTMSSTRTTSLNTRSVPSRQQRLSPWVELAVSSRQQSTARKITQGMWHINLSFERLLTIFCRYIPGIWATMACQFTMLTLLAINSFVFARRNRLYREGKRGPPEDTPGFSYTI